MRTGILPVVALLLFLVSVAGCVVVPGSCRSGKFVFQGFALAGYPVTSRQLAELPRKDGAPPDLILFYLQWPSLSGAGHSRFPDESVQRIWAAGAVPCITWEPMYVEGQHEVAVPAAQITAGVYDDYIREFAARAGQWGHPVLIRFAHEMNLRRYHWGTTEQDYGPGSPDLYRAMFRHVVNVARTAGGTNLLWVFCPNAESVPAAGGPSLFEWNAATRYYPGDDVVDLLGLDGYNWGNSCVQAQQGWTSHPQTFREIFQIPSESLRKLAPSKPLIVFETASVGLPAQKMTWFEDAIAACPSLGISGLVWFQVNKENDWALPGTASAVSAAGGGSRYTVMRDWVKELNR